MGKFLSGCILPMLLLTAALLNWSLISLVDLLAFLLLQYTCSKHGSRSTKQPLISWHILIFSFLTILSHAIFQIVLAAKGEDGRTTDAQWAKLVGFTRVQSGWYLPTGYFLVVQVLVAVVASVEIYGNKCGLDICRDSSMRHLCSSAGEIGYNLRIVCCLLLPVIQLVAGISHPSWASLPFFICSSVGLVDWSLTSNFLGLFRWWRYLLWYNGVNILLLYIYQLPVEFPETVIMVSRIFGFFKISSTSDISEICSGVTLLLFYVMLSSVRSDLDEMDSILSTRESDLTEPLLQPKHSFFIHRSRSGIRHSNVLLRGPVFRIFSINFFVYGFPVSLLVISFWSFHFASLCAFALLVYIGYILFSFPSMFHLHRLNGMLLVFILLWAATTYVFNVAFAVSSKNLWKDTGIWETIGFLHCTTPAYYLLAQFGVGVLVSMSNLVSNSVFSYLSDGEVLPTTDDSAVEVADETNIMFVATIAWGLCRSSSTITLALILFVAMKPGLIHALYMVFFLMYLFSPKISSRLRQAMILLCEVHLALLYILQLRLISKYLQQNGALAVEILSQLGLINHIGPLDFFKIAVLACFCAIQNHGLQTLLSFSAILQHTTYPPIGCSTLKAATFRSILLCVCSTKHREGQTVHGQRTASYLETIEKKFLSTYRSFGTPIMFLTILLSVYLVTPNHASLGYLLFLVLWMSRRQLIGESERRYWLPMKVYAAIVFISIYSLDVYPSLQLWLSRFVDLQSAFGYNPEATMLENIWVSLEVLLLMQLYTYAKRQSNSSRSSDCVKSQSGALAFVRRLLIWHSEKILSVALFYASLSPIGAFGFLYLLGLVICAMLPKLSSIPSKLFISYSGFLIMFEYLFQMWGYQAAMFPGQEHAQVSLFLGLRAYEPGFFGLESGLRGKVLVVVACILQYSVFHWLEKMPSNDMKKGKWEEPCSLFTLAQDEAIICSKDNTQSKEVSPPLTKRDGRCHSWPRIYSNLSQGRGTSSETEGYERDSSKRYLHFNFWESSNDTPKWNRKRILFLRRERFEMQKVILKLSLKFGLENMFNLFSLEINMIALLLASFSVLNVISLLYIASVAACALLHRHVIKKLWPIFVFLFAFVVTIEYVAMWINLTSSNQSMQRIQAPVPCHDCWRATNAYFSYCKKCWLGVIADDPRVLISYYTVFMLSCFKLRADRLSIFSESEIYKRIQSQWKHVSQMIDLPFETKGLWTLLDFLKLYSYCHLLDLVLSLILMTGTLEFDILHLGYLGFALAFIRLRPEILKKRNKIFRFLRIYNFALIVLSLAYQSPFVAYSGEAKHDSVQNISEVIGFYKYDYGFRITSRSSLVEIVIFILVSLQSHMFSSQQFDYVSKYLETEQVGAILRDQEKKAAWKTAQLQHMCKAEEEKRLRNIQVKQMRFEMLSLQKRLYNNTVTVANHSNSSVEIEGQRKKRNVPRDLHRMKSLPNKMEIELKKEDFHRSGSMFHISANELPPIDRSGLPVATNVRKSAVDSLHEIAELEKRASSNVSLDSVSCYRAHHPMRSAVHLLEDGVSQLKSLGNKTVNNLVSLLKLEREKPDTNDYSSDDEVYYEIEDQNIGIEHLEPTSSTHSVIECNMSDSVYAKIGIIVQYIWSQVRSNNDVVCYCCFVLIYVWNFSLFSTFYLAALFLYALCVNTGPNHVFWIVVLIYTEVCILLQYIYQIIIQHCDWNFDVGFLQELGFPADKIMSSFVTSNLPLFLVYLCTLLQTSITARDGDWAIAADFSFHKRRICKHEKDVKNLRFVERLKEYYVPLRKIMKLLVRSLHRYWKSLIEGSETPPYFLQLSMEVNPWPEDGIQPHTIESGINKLLKLLNIKRCKERNLTHLSPSRVRVQSIEKNADNETVGLAVFDVLHAAPSTESGSEEGYNSLTPAADVADEIRRAHFAGDFKEIRFPYPILSTVGGGKREIDLYAYIFCADLAVFFLIAIFYQSVIKNNSEFLEVYQLEDQFPKEFVFVLMVVFFLIVLDRIIYLCSFAIGKVIFYTFNLILFTSSVTRYAWGIGISLRHSGKFALRAIFLTKAISLALQAVQIRFGMPQKSTLYRQFLTSSISKFYYCGFRLYRALPFLYELRCVLDWSCTTTSLTMHDWLKLEDIHASLFLVKCDVELNRTGHQQGQRQSKMTKFSNGICLFFVLICVIWAPMLMYSSGNPTNIANPIKDATARVEIKSVGGRLTLFETSLCEKISWTELDSHENLDPFGFLSSYNEEDIQLICCQADASTVWLVPPVVQARFMESIRWAMYFSFSWQFTRDRPKGKEVVKYELDIPDQDLPMTSDVIEVLNGTSNSFRINNVYPRYFRVTGSGEVRLLEHKVDPVNGDLVLNRGHPEWWSFHDFDRSLVRRCGELPGPMAIIVSEETPQGILGETLSKFSIWGLYITFVLAVGRFIRLQCADLRMRIPFENLPSCDRLLTICEDIYTARAEGELEVEEALYWMLVNVYRSPHLLLEYTRPN